MSNAKPPSKKSQVLKIVVETPSTSVEIAAITGIGMQSVSAMLTQMWQSGALKRKPIPNSMGGTTFLYSTQALP
jgi:predicted transcriptional regulator